MFSDIEGIEQAVLKYPDIDNACVVICELNHEKHLCAYFTSKININTDDLRDYMGTILSDNMIPTFFIQMDKFPETSQGNIDREILSKPNEPTLLPYNKKIKNNILISSESIDLNKSSFYEFCDDNNIDYELLILTATCITLTKYTNSTEIFIRFNNTSLIFNDRNRDKPVSEYIATIEQNLNSQYSTDFLFNVTSGDCEVSGDNMHLNIEENALRLKFDSNKYASSYIKTFLKCIIKVLNQIKEYGVNELKIKDIRLRDEEKEYKVQLKRNPLVNELLEEQANKTPDKVALRCCGESYTFKEVNNEANKIANALIKSGIKKGSSISFMLNRDKTLITTFLGIIKAGCVAIPIDINYSAERIKYILHNSDSDYIITDESFEGAIRPQDLIDGGDSSFPKVDLKPDNPICLIYTSGSTGNPKGVILTHCGISNVTSVHIKNNYKKLLSISSISFDISEEDILVALTNDKELIFADDDEIEDIILLARLIEQTEPEFVNLTPSRLLSYLQVPEFSDAINKFKGIGCGGEQFTRNVYESIRKFTDIDIYNGYGPLECSFTSNSKKIENPDYITNGKPLLNYITDVRDIDGKLLPYGVIGELYIGGIGVSKGYYNLDEKTSESFISINDVPYYKTGDHAIQLPSDEIIIKGRVDNQIKLRGQRVEPEEIEQVILKYSHIDNAVALIHELNHEKHLCAYFTSKIKINTDDLKEHISAILPAYMIPTFFIQMDKFPETSSGKINRKMLPKPKINSKYEKPSDNFETAVYNLCSEILDYEDFGVSDNLFKLGFSSLTLMKLNSDIYHEFHVSLAYSDLMTNPTVRQIADLLKKSDLNEDIDKVSENDFNEYPMSSQQKRLYVLYLKNPLMINYNLVNLTEVKNSLDISKLENSINKVIGSEEILRTSFHVINGEYVQKIHENRDIHIDLIELEDNADITEICYNLINPFNLEKDSLLRVKIIKYNNKTYVFRDMHHIIGDQISNSLLYDKIKNAYYNNDVIPCKIQYKDYTMWVQKKQDSEAEYWMNKNIQQYGTAVFEDFKRPLIQSFNGEKLSYTLDKKIIENIAQKNNTTIFKLLLSQFVVLLYKYTNEDTIQIGTITSGRTHPDFQKTLGMFVNTLPFIQTISSHDTLKETLQKSEKELSDLFNNQNYSIDRIMSDLNIQSDISRNPLFDIVFLQQTGDDFEGNLKWDDSKFDLTCSVKNSSDDLTVELDYNKDLYSFEKINGLLNHYIYLIDNIEENLDKKIEDIKILSHSQEEEILKSTGFKSIEKTEHILTALKKQIAENPAKVILADSNNQITYKDFDLKTNSFANYLKDIFNVKKQDAVILMAERSIESVLSFYSILKLNAVYVPINPFSPENRLKHIIDEVNPKVILTNIDLDIDNIDIININQKSLYEYGDSSYIDSSPEGNLAIIHTSGTTGYPKGVLISHENIENFLINCDIFYDENTEIFYHTTNIGFDTSLFEIIFPLITSQLLYVINENYDFSKIPDNILNQKSIINTVPSKLKMFFELSCFDNVMKNLSQLVLAGESLDENLVSQILSNCSPVIYNAYGPCEATIFASIKKIDTKDSITIGKPNLNTDIYILNDDNQLCPIGIPGELCIGGKQLSEGYLNHSNEAFSDNPFNEGRLYHTGDLACLDSNGEINFIGRSDSQIKINGQRIELDEINRQIEKNKDIRHAVTVLNENHLNSYIVSDKVIDIDNLLNDLEFNLLPFMIPSSVMQIDSIPLTGNGKIDTKKLPLPQKTRNTYKAPTSDIEKLIVEIEQEVLNIERIGINDNFYQLGGDSIKAIRIISLLQNQGISCTVQDILTYKTPALIAEHAQKEVAVFYDSFEGELDLLPIQKYFFDQINRNDYVQEFVLELKSKVDIEILHDAFDNLTNLHDMLRVVFKFENEEYVQEILPLNTRVCEIREYSLSDNFNHELNEIYNRSVNSIDIENKLMDVSLIHNENQDYLLIVCHHLIIDGVSWSILIEDLTYIIKQIKKQAGIDLPKSSYSYKNWVNNVASLVEDISDNEKQHWIRINELLDDSIIKGKSKGFNFNIDAIFDVNNLLMLSEEEYWALCIARAYKKTYGRNIIFNRESHGRYEGLANVSRTIGWFTSQFPVFVDTNNGYDRISLMQDIYTVKKAFNNVDCLGLNYESLIYSTNEFEYKHCPVTFNFLSTEFSFENDLFKSYNSELSNNGVLELTDSNHVSFGINLDISHGDDYYFVSGSYAEGNYLGDKFAEFIENIKYELKFVGNYDCDVISCCLSESQLGVYLDEKVNEKSTAYSVDGIFKCPQSKSVDEIESAVSRLIDKHPVLKSRIVDGEVPLLICDSYPSIEIMDNYDYSELIKPFDLNESLARFYIIENNNEHFVFYDIHHIISDATSSSIINKELSCALDDFLDGSVDLGFLYASNDSFNSQFESNYYEAHEFYRNNLCDIEETADLLYDVGGVDNTIKLPIHGVRDNVEIFCRNCGITVGNFLNSVFAYTYSRFTGSSKVYYTFTEHGRHENYTHNALGMFVRTIPIIVNCENTPVKNYLQSVSDLILDSMKYNVYPFRLLAHEFDLRNNVTFEYNSDLNDVSGIDDELIIEKHSNAFVSDFLCVINDLSDGYLISIESSADYSNDIVIRFLNVFNEVLIGLMDNNTLSDINYVSQDDLGLLDEINDTEHNLVYGDILDAFNDNLVNGQDNKLVLHENISYSYGEGAFIASRIAESLTELGVESQDCVGFLVLRSELYILNILGIMSAGAVYVPLDDDLPDERIRFILEDSGCKVVIVSDETNMRLSNLNCDCSILNLSDIINDDIGSLSSLPVSYGDLACILYTSGTMGHPKGVKITRKSILNVCEEYADNYGLNSEDIYGLFSAIGFDVSNFVIFVVLYCGCCLSVVPADIRFNMTEMNNYFIKHGVTHAFITTQVGKLFMESVDDTSLDVLFVAGEKLGKVENPQNYTLVDGYGPTEAFAFMSSIPNSEKIHESSVGYLNYNMKAYVLDNEGRRVPCGAVGELYLAGYQIAEGYMNRENETKNAFIKNPFENDSDYALMYRTGDMVRVLSDDSLGIVGRRDSQVKIRGNRVELGEVETVIRELDYIDEVVVQTVKIEDNYELAAYVVSDEIDEDFVRNDILEYVGSCKPVYMIPSFIVFLDSLPLTINSKIDYNALPEVNVDSLHVEYTAPTNETEMIIVEAFEEIFNQKNIGVNDDFIRMGGDSITLMRLISLLEKNGIHCRVADILNYKTPYLIAQNMDKITKESYEDTVGDVDLFPIQSYFFDQINNNEFTQEFILKSKSDLDLDILQSAFDELSNVHDMLRSTYRYDDGNNVVQKILPLNTRVCEIKEYTTDDLEKTFENIIEVSKKSIDIGSDLIKISLIHHNDDDYVVFVIHHLIIDGVSWNVLFSDLTDIYQGLNENNDIDILKPYPYKKWIDDVKGLVNSISPEEKNHWNKINLLLKDENIKGKAINFSFSADALYDVNNILMLSEEEYLALVISRAYKKTYGKDIIFNRESHGRDESIANVHRTVGWFTSQYPIPVNISTDNNDISIIKDVFALKKAFKDVGNLGLNYASLIYTTKELKYLHCPVTFNFLSDEFSFENNLFKSVSHNFNSELSNFEVYGVDFNINHLNDSYYISGSYADNTYLADYFNTFVANIKQELEFLGNYKGNIVCNLSEPQLEVYYNEKNRNMGTAYSTYEIVECSLNQSNDEIKSAIQKLIDKHPILKGRILDDEEMPLLICDSYPLIEIRNDEDYSNLINEFDLEKCLARFFIIDKKDHKYIFYDIHHLINDGTGFNIIRKDLTYALNDSLDSGVDLGFVYASRDSFESRFKSGYKKAYDFYSKEFSNMKPIKSIPKGDNGCESKISLPIPDVRRNVEEFSQKNNITVSTFLNAVFAFTYSRFIDSEEVFYTFVEHGRHETYTHNALGMFAVTTPILVDCQKDTVKDYLSYFSNLSLNSMRNNVYPFRLLSQEFNLNNNVRFEYNFDLNDVSDVKNHLVIEDKISDDFSEFFCIINDIDEGYLIHIRHCDKFSSDTVVKFAELYCEFLTEFLNKEKLDEIIYY